MSDNMEQTFDNDEFGNDADTENSISKDNQKDNEEENMETVRCEECGKEIALEDAELITIDGKEEYVCKSCLEELYTCEDCGCYVRDDNTYLTHDGRIICPDCYSNNYGTCDECEEIFSNDEMRYDDYGCSICEDCFERYDYIQCEDCGRITQVWSYNENDDCYYCNDCYPEHCDNENTFFHEYGYKPDPDFKSTKDDPMDYNGYIGIEMETDGGYRSRIDEDWFLDNFKEDFYCKSDCSLRDGIEIVSHPRTLNSWMEYYNDGSFDKMASHFLKAGYRAHDTTTCGLHLHLSRNYFGDSTKEQDLAIMKTVILIERFWDNLITKIGRRKETGYCYRISTDSSKEEAKNENQLAYKIKDEIGGTRYNAVNICNYSTVEFRFPKGTLRTKTVIATIQFIQYLVDFAKASTTEFIFDVTEEQFIKGIEYKELSEYLKERGIQEPTSFDIKDYQWRQAPLFNTEEITGDTIEDTIEENNEEEL